MMNKYTTQGLTFTLGFLLISILVGCSGEDTKQKDTQKKEDANVVQVSQIEVIHNENAHATKVQKKDRNTSQNNSYYYDYNIKSEYDENAQPQNHDASVRVKPRTSVEANMNIRSPYEKVQVSMLVKKLSKEFIVKCSACHNDYANGIIGPSLLNRDVEYIYKKIHQFKTGEKSNPLMSDLVKMMDEKEIKKLAKEIFEFNEEINKMRN